MSDRKKFPSISTAPLVERPPDLNIPDVLFEGCSSRETYSSRPFIEIDDFEGYAKDLCKAFKKNGRGETLFPDEGQFLRELDNALLHYEMFRPIVTPEIYGTFKEQREYFIKLKKALQIRKPSSRLTKVHRVLYQITDCNLSLKPRSEGYLRRLIKAKFDMAALKRIETASLDTGQSADRKLIHDFDQLNVAVDIVLNDLKGNNSGQHAELYLLIEQLAEMYEICSNSKPPKTVPTYEEQDKGIFFKIVKSIIPLVYFSNKYTKTDSAIFEGIRLLK